VSQAETIAWNRARRRGLIELAAAIVAAGGVVVMVAVFYTILTR